MRGKPKKGKSQSEREAEEEQRRSKGGAKKERSKACDTKAASGQNNSIVGATCHTPPRKKNSNTKARQPQAAKLTCTDADTKKKTNANTQHNTQQHTRIPQHTTPHHTTTHTHTHTHTPQHTQERARVFAAPPCSRLPSLLQGPCARGCTPPKCRRAS